MKQYEMVSLIWSYAMMVNGGNSDESLYFAKRVMEWFKMRNMRINSITDLRKMDENCFSKKGNLTRQKKTLLDIWNLLDEIGA